MAATVFVAAVLGATATAFAGDTGSDRFLSENGVAKPTRAWKRFCEADPANCVVDIGEKRIIPDSERLRADLARVNREVNKAIRAVTDQEHWGTSDRWDFPTDGEGDCEDIQIEKRRQLVALGYPGRAMRMAVVINPEGEGHAVLVVRTSRGDYVLDNRTNAVMPWFALHYTWVKLESDTGGEQWAALGGVRSPVETADDQP